MSKKKNSALDTRKKGGKAPPDVSFDDVVKDLFKYFKGLKGLQDAESEIEKKYNIDKNKNKTKNKNNNENDWNEDDVKKAWGKTQRMYKYSRRRKTWSLAIICHAISDITLNKTNCSCEKIEDINVGPNAGTERILQARHVITQNNTEKRSYHDFLKNDDSTMDEPTKSQMSNAATESQNFTCENSPNTNEEANAGTAKKECTSNLKRAVKKPETGIKKMCGNRTSNTSRKFGSYADPQTVYIRIPLSLLDVSQGIISQKAEKKSYKLIDGVPSLTQTMKKTSYVVQYDNRTKNPAWVFEILNKQSLEPKDPIEKPIRSNNFFQDFMIHEHFTTPHNVSYEDPYVKGHMAAAFNHNWSQKAMDDTSFISNIAPQNQNLNKSAWHKLENKCRAYTEDYNNVYVYTGPLYCPPDPNIDTITYQIKGGKAVPTHFFKVIILEKQDGTLDVKCNIADNADGQIYEDIKLDDIERLSGLVFSEKSHLVSNEERVTVKWTAREETGLGRVPVMKKHHSV
ncbi:uncharacterized protein LOC130424324 isoform X2 [Triplophysa dalaica]|uniref:uncharacterized protein LOC130424324 isoform X2 n=1 Tax=Triplophysa dalaica TaxID=1582913 RepID=UPI0024DF3A90|nr:uncharacterized protein LOC130424324 isoform X2 [Triplophysa dalaica]